ncbi:hypothetical protein [Flavobacterium sp.]|uniref:hypothetical protein n=1 Tax=Flavobacterium sp. TaxID=239 RepID=UPI003750A575
MNLNKIPIDFRGHNTIEIYKNLKAKKTNLQKNEFETTEQFEKRLSIETERKVLGTLNEDDLFAIKSQYQNLNCLKFKYDADNQEVELAIELKDYINEENKIEFDGKKKSIEISKSTLKNQKYNGKNAFGVSKEINSRQELYYNLQIENWKSFINKDNLINLKFKVKPNIAKKIKEEDLYGYNGLLGFIYIGKINESLVSNGYYYSGKPTITKPYEFEYNINYIDFDLYEIWVYNKNTGEILSKVKPKEAISCEVSYTIKDYELNGNTQTFDSFNFTEVGQIIFNVSIIGMDKGKVFIRSLAPETTINDESLLSQAKKYVEKLIFKSENNKSQNGIITLDFKKFEIKNLKID